MISFYARTHEHAYARMLHMLLTDGKEVTVRDRPTLELLNSIVEIEEPTERCIFSPGRRWNPWLAMSEGLWILAGSNEIKHLQPFNKRIVEFSDDGVTNYGAYGKRLHENGLFIIEEMLRKDPESRRAVVPIYEPRDAGAESKDIPCNTSLMFKIRDGKLHMTVTNRSNDIHWGLFAVNFCQFSMVQEALAYALDVKVGTQVHFSQSLHVYTDKWGSDITNRMYAAKNVLSMKVTPSRMFEEEREEIPRNLGVISFLSAAALVGNYDWGSGDDFFAFANAFLNVYRNNTANDIRFNELVKISEYWNDYHDWIAAGKLFCING